MRIKHALGAASLTHEGKSFEADEHGYIDAPYELAQLLLVQTEWSAEEPEALSTTDPHSVLYVDPALAEEAAKAEAEAAEEAEKAKAEAAEAEKAKAEAAEAEKAKAEEKPVTTSGAAEKKLSPAQKAAQLKAAAAAKK